MQLVANSIDGFLAYWSNLNEVSGEIHSVFERAVNIKTSSGQLVSVLSSAGLDGPNTLVVELPRGNDFITMGLKTGMSARLGREGATFGEGVLCLRISGAQHWWPRLAGGDERLQATRLKRNLAALLKGLPQGKDHKGLGMLMPMAVEMVAGRWTAVQHVRLNQLSRWALPGIRSLLTGTLGHDQILLEKGLDQLLGLGTGFTPSGDDLLVGYLGTLKIISRRVGGPELGNVLEVTGRHLRHNRNRTTFASGNLLLYACQGRISSSMLAVVRALLFGTHPQARSAARDLMQMGASSGSEVLLGILLALSLMLRLSEVSA